MVAVDRLGPSFASLNNVCPVGKGLATLLTQAICLIYIHIDPLFSAACRMECVLYLWCGPRSSSRPAWWEPQVGEVHVIDDRCPAFAVPKALAGAKSTLEVYECSNQPCRATFSSRRRSIEARLRWGVEGQYRIIRPRESGIWSVCRSKLQNEAKLDTFSFHHTSLPSGPFFTLLISRRLEHPACREP